MAKRTWVKWGGLVAAAFCVVGLVMIWGKWFAPSPAKAGTEKSQLAACPNSPNCVCSCDTDEEHAIAPLAFDTAPEDAFAELENILKDQPQAKIVTAGERYLHVEFTTPWLRFVDDVEFLLAPEDGVIHVRSASRVGYSDMGANRKRVEAIRREFDSQKTPAPLNR